MDSLRAFCNDHCHIQLNSSQIEQFRIYQKELVTWNKKFNLTSIIDPLSIEIKHFIDSLTPLLIIRPASATRLIDIGTGAGFPGIPLKIIFPDTDIFLLDATQKKVDFCRYLLEKINLNPDAALVGRAEDVAHHIRQREKYDISISRAVASLPALLELLLPFVKVGGISIAMKGKCIQQELASTDKALQILGGKIEVVQKISLPILNEERNLIKILKINPTPQKYPRRPGLPIKKPLI